MNGMQTTRLFEIVLILMVLENYSIPFLNRREQFEILPKPICSVSICPILPYMTYIKIERYMILDAT
jgi:hypothetical protein